MLPIIQNLWIAIACLAVHSNAFVVRSISPLQRGRRSTGIRFAANGESGSAEDLFLSEGWQPIQKDLDRLPVFTCANEEGNPVAYTVQTQDGQSFTVPFFYTDVEDAEAELRKAKEAPNGANLAVIPYPLGKAFQLWALNKSVIVPNKKQILLAGAPPTTNPIGQEVPLFACELLVRFTEDGEGTVMPLFMTFEDAKKALTEAVGNDDAGKVEDLEIVSLSLNRAVELLANDPETAFQFVGSEKSFEFVKQYMKENKPDSTD